MAMGLSHVLKTPWVLHPQAVFEFSVSSGVPFRSPKDIL